MINNANIRHVVVWGWHGVGISLQWHHQHGNQTCYIVPMVMCMESPKLKLILGLKVFY